MEAVKNAIFTACFCAVLASAVKMISTERMKNEMRLVCALLIIICAASQFVGAMPVLEDISENFDRSEEYERLIDEYGKTVTEQTDRALEQALEEQLARRGINVTRAVIDCTTDEYNYIKAVSAVIYISEGDADAVKAAASELLGDAQIEVISDEG